MASVFGSRLSSLASIPARYPFAFGVGLSCVKTSFSDLLVQKVVERRETVDWKRNMAFATFGFFYLGGVQYTIYVPIFGRLFPTASSFAAKSIREKLRDGRGMLAMLAQVFLDQCVHHPLMYFPVFYCTKELVTAEGAPDFGRCLREYRQNMVEDLSALWKVWVPATLINFSFMPMYARIPFVAGVSLLWTCILSAMRGGDVVHGDEMTGGAVTGASLKIMEEGLGELFAYTCPVDLDKGLTHVVISASGPDRAGWVALLSREVANHGGNVTHSKMVRLGTEFIILMHVGVAPERQRELIQALHMDEDLKPLNIRTSGVSRRETGSFIRATTGLRIHAVGTDSVGTLASLSEKICELGMSIENVSTELRMRKDGRREFVVNADCVTVQPWDKHALGELANDFSGLKDALGLDILDVRIHKVKTAE